MGRESRAKSRENARGSTRRTACNEVIKRGHQEFGKLDFLINNAAFQMTHEKIEEFTTEEFDRTFKTNVYALFWLTRAALMRMQPGSLIINTASIQAFDPSPYLLPYAATKAAIVSLTKCCRKLAWSRVCESTQWFPDPSGRRSFRLPCRKKRSKASARTHRSSALRSP
jgi:NAD(P)-dependent dehydrogenase (short-subunit alcohol dehydrogenase family)